VESTPSIAAECGGKAPLFEHRDVRVGAGPHPAHAYHTLLGEGVFLGSIRTMQRLLKEAGQSRDRRLIRPAQTHAIPRLQACAPNQVNRPVFRGGCLV